MTSEISSSENFNNILNLPKDKSVLDFIKNKLSEHGSLERFEVINELFEMYRTSTGFDPSSLSKGRFKRIKATALKQILADINSELPSIVDSSEYKQYLLKQDHSMVILESFKWIKNKIEKNDFTGVDKEIQHLKEQILLSDNRELLKVFEKLFKPLIKNKGHFG